MERTTEPTTTRTTEIATSTTGTTEDPWISEYANLAKDEFEKMILMGEKKNMSWFFSFVTLYILSLIMGTITVAVKKKDKCQICKIPKIFSDVEKDVEKNYDYNFLFGIILNSVKSWLNFLITKKNVSNAFRESKNSGVVTGTLANTGA